MHMYNKVYNQMQYYLDEGVNKRKLLNLIIEDFNEDYIISYNNASEILMAVRDFTYDNEITLPIQLKLQMMSNGII